MRRLRFARAGTVGTHPRFVAMVRELIEERLTGRRLETWDVYQIASDHSTLARGVLRTIAFVDVNAGGELMKFAETVANNRGVPMRLFATVAEAEAWLAGQPR
mgnify:CR=1 FL=1